MADIKLLIRLVDCHTAMMELFRCYEEEILASDELKELFVNKREEIKKKSPESVFIFRKYHPDLFRNMESKNFITLNK